MKKVLFVGLGIVFLLGVGYFFGVRIDTEDPYGREAPQITTFRVEGLRFDYPTGPDGYVLEETTPTDTQDGLVRTLVLMQTEDAEKDMPVDGEGPPVIEIRVFDIAKEIGLQEWAEQNLAYSTLNLRTSDVLETTLNNAPAIRYMADGLYPSEKLIVLQENTLYVITGQFIDPHSTIRQDFEPFLQSIRFVSR